MEECEDHLLAGNYVECIACCKAALEFLPKNELLWYYLAQSQRATSNQHEALYSYDRAIELSFEKPEYLWGKAFALSGLGNRYKDARYYQQSLECFKKLVINDTGTADRYQKVVVDSEALRSIYYHYGATAVKSGRLEETQSVSLTSEQFFETAIVALTKSLEYGEKSDTFILLSEAKYRLAMIRTYDIDLLRQALFYVDQAILSVKEDHSTYHTKGSILLLIGRLTNDMHNLLEAVELLEHAKNLSLHVSTGRELCRAYHEIGIRTNSVDYFRQGIKSLVPPVSREDYADDLANRASNLYFIAKLTEEEELYETTIRICEEALAIKPSVEFGYGFLARAMADYGFRFKKKSYLLNSIKFFEKATELSPEDNLPLFYYAIALFHIGDLTKDPIKINEGIEKLDFFLGEHPGVGDAYFLKAASLKLTRKFGNEVEDIEIAGALLKGFYLGADDANGLRFLMDFFLDYEPESILFLRIINRNPQLLVYPRYEAAYNASTFRYRGLLMLLGELLGSSGLYAMNPDYLTYRAVLMQLHGDTITAFELHDKLIDTITPENLRHQYYYLLATRRIEHEDAALILFDAVKRVEELYNEDARLTADQQFYCAGIFMIAEKYDEAISILLELVDNGGYVPAWFQLAECYSFNGNKVSLDGVAEEILKSGKWHEVASFEVMPSSTGGAEELIRYHESLSGWFTVGMVIDIHEQGLAAEKISVVRSKFFELTRPQAASHFVDSDIPNLGLKELEKLRGKSELLMPRLFIYVQENNTVDIEKLAERMVSQMQDEKNHNGRISFEGYLELLSYVFYEGKISSRDFGLGYVYVKLKEVAMNRGVRKFSQHIIHFVLRETISRVVQVIGESVSGLPLKVLIKLIIGNTDHEKLLAMNFYHFVSYFEEISHMQSTDLSEFLEGHELTQYFEHWIKND